MKKYGLVFMICSFSLEAMNVPKTMIGFAIGMQTTIENERKEERKNTRTDETYEKESSAVVPVPVNASEKESFFRKNRVQRRMRHKL
ncbi:MAG TPA: hypothetical protein VHO47_01120 [Candidatus Babeliales bacterium]|nr:hypothetical protein [Candidatus Babeliales bacterium]